MCNPDTFINGPGGDDWQCPHCASVNIRGFSNPGDIAMGKKVLLECHCGGISDLMLA
jgi:hypothetical protein